MLPLSATVLTKEKTKKEYVVDSDLESDTEEENKVKHMSLAELQKKLKEIKKQKADKEELEYWSNLIKVKIREIGNREIEKERINNYNDAKRILRDLENLLKKANKVLEDYKTGKKQDVQDDINNIFDKMGISDDFLFPVLN